MNVVKQLDTRLRSEPHAPHSETLKDLIKALYLNEKHDLSALYELAHEDFKLAMSIIEHWRLYQFTARREQLGELAGLSRY